jgi:predicted CoA-binding protein
VRPVSDKEQTVKHDQYDKSLIRDVLKSTKTIAVVGASANPSRPSYGVMHFLLSKGYHVIPVNPGHAGQEIHGQKVVARLSDIDEPIDMVDVFRAADQLPSVIDEVLALDRLPKVIWGQLTVRNDAAAEKAEDKGITMIMDRCPAIEYPRLFA